MPGINFYELLVLLVMAVVILGPERLPQYAQKLTSGIRTLRSMADDAKDKFKEETGTDFSEVDWRRYDPRQYDPRRIIREALTEDTTSSRALDSVGIDADMRDSMRTARTAMDPRDLFGADSAEGRQKSGSSIPAASGVGLGGAAAAGMAGAAVTADGNATESDPQPLLVPFDDEAT